VREKLITANDAAMMVETGMHLGVASGMSMNPMPVIREIIKNGVKDLTVTSVITGGYIVDLLIGAGCVSAVRFPQISMGEYGLAPNFRSYSQAGKLTNFEMT